MKTSIIKVTIPAILFALAAPIAAETPTAKEKTAKVTKAKKSHGDTHADIDKANSEAASQASLNGKVNSKLNANKDLRSLNIKSDVSDAGAVTLSGEVETAEEKQLVEDLVASIEGVSKVRSNLMVRDN